MTAIGGSIPEISIAGRAFFVAADADASMKIGGFENDVEPNGNGSARMIKKRMSWSVSGLTLSIDDSNGDLEFLQSVADSLDFVAITITKASGAVYNGVGTVSGEFMKSSMSQTCDVTLSGPNKLTPQS